MRGPAPLVSVIIPCWNGGAWLRDALRSVAAQDMDEVEVIVVDDGSTDDSAEIARREWPEVTLLQEGHRGASHARNAGTQRARGAFIQYLDADDLLVLGKLRTQIDALVTSGAEVAYGDWEEMRAGPAGGSAPSRIVARRLNGAAEIELFTDFWCPPAAYLFRRSIVDRVGLWNERLPIIQDARFALDCALRGAAFVYCPGVMARYRVHAGPSLSGRDPVAFVRDCLTNANEVEAWWIEHGGVTPVRRAALVRVYGYVARASFERDPPTFERAWQRLQALSPGYVPAAPRHLAAASRALGYRRAEAVAVWYRRAKRLLHP